MLPNLTEAPLQMEGISEEAEHEDAQVLDEEADDDVNESGLGDEALPEWAKRLAFMDSDLGSFVLLTIRDLPLIRHTSLSTHFHIDRTKSLLLSLLPPHLQRILPTSSPSFSDTSRTEFLASLSSGQLLCVAYNTGVRKSKQPWGYINKEGIHDILALQAEAEKDKATGEKDSGKKNGMDLSEV